MRSITHTSDQNSIIVHTTADYGGTSFIDPDKTTLELITKTHHVIVASDRFFRLIDFALENFDTQPGEDIE